MGDGESFENFVERNFVNKRLPRSENYLYVNSVLMMKHAPLDVYTHLDDPQNISRIRSIYGSMLSEQVTQNKILAMKKCSEDLLTNEKKLEELLGNISSRVQSLEAANQEINEFRKHLSLALKFLNSECDPTFVAQIFVPHYVHGNRMKELVGCLSHRINKFLKSQHFKDYLSMLMSLMSVASLAIGVSQYASHRTTLGMYAELARSGDPVTVKHLAKPRVE